MLVAVAALVATALAAPPTLADCAALWGAPSRSAVEAERTRSHDEPLLIY